MSTEQLFTQYPDIMEMFSREKQSIDSKNSCTPNEENTIPENTILETTTSINSFNNNSISNCYNIIHGTHCNTIKYSSVFLYNRTSNADEVKRIITSLSIAKTFLGPITDRLGSNPTAGSFIRDWVKYGALSFDSYFFGDIEIGGTGIKRTDQELEGTKKRVWCKTLGITLGTGLLGPDALATLGLTFNFVCEPFARIEKVASREYQRNCEKDPNCSLSAEEYEQKNIDVITKSAIKESLPKSFTSDILLGETIKPGFKMLADGLGSLSGFLSTKVCLLYTGVSNPLRGNIYTKTGACFAAGQGVNMITKGTVWGGLVLVEGSITFIGELLKTNIFVPTVSAIADGGIPDILFGSISQLGSTITGTVVTITCISSIADPTKISKGLCFLGGIGIKTSLDEVTPVEVKDQLFGSVTKFGHTIVGEVIASSCLLAVTNPPMMGLCLLTGMGTKKLLDVTENTYGLSSSIGHTVNDIANSDVVTSIPNQLLGSNPQIATTAAGTAVTMSCLQFAPPMSKAAKGLCLLAGTGTKIVLDVSDVANSDIVQATSNQLFGSPTKFANTVAGALTTTACVALTGNIPACLVPGSIIKGVLDVTENAYGVSSSIGHVATEIVTSDIVTEIPDQLFGSPAKIATATAGAIATTACLGLSFCIMGPISFLTTSACFGVGGSIKVGSDYVISSYTEPDTMGTNVAGEHHDTHDDL